MSNWNTLPFILATKQQAEDCGINTATLRHNIDGESVIVHTHLLTAEQGIPLSYMGSGLTYEQTQELMSTSDWSEPSLEELQKEVVKKLKAEKNDNNFEMTVISACRGLELGYTMNLVMFNELESMIKTSKASAYPYILWHDDSKDTHEIDDPYTVEEGEQLIIDASLARAYRQAKYEIWIERAKACATVEELDNIRTEDWTPQEQAYVDMVLTMAIG